MRAPQATMVVNLDTTNPGHVIACCGLLELAHRQCPAVEGWFDGPRFLISIPGESEGNALSHLVNTLTRCQISGLSLTERDDRDRLEKESRQLKKQGSKLPPDQEQRRRDLGERARAGLIQIEEPFRLILDWWQAGDEDATPKTWAGLQELHKIARAAQDALAGATELALLLDYGCILRMPAEYCKAKADGQKAVEPFYFDARRFAHALDAGFSLDTQDAETIAHPAVELLCLVGLQRFRPAPALVRGTFDYWTWGHPLGALVAAPVFSGVSPIPGRQGYRFRLRFRDDQKRYKAFDFATPVGGE